MSAPPRVAAPSGPSDESPSRPAPTAIQPPETSDQPVGPGMTHNTSKKKRNHRGGKKKRTRKQSFAVPAEGGEDSSRRRGDDDEQHAARASFYRLQNAPNASNTSLESEALLDHR